MAVSPYTVSVPCPQCGRYRLVGSKHKARASRGMCGDCATKLRAERARRHGECETRLYHIWEGMKARCGLNKGAPPRITLRYRDRGISVCEEWAGSYEAFCNWALANGYADHLSIDRLDGDLDYSPENCRWATRKEQQRNRRCNRLITLDGRTQPLIAWAEERGLSYTAVFKRLKAGWSVDRALSEPIRGRSTKNAQRTPLFLDHGIRTA